MLADFDQLSRTVSPNLTIHFLLQQLNDSLQDYSNHLFPFTFIRFLVYNNYFDLALRGSSIVAIAQLHSVMLLLIGLLVRDLISVLRLFLIPLNHSFQSSLNRDVSVPHPVKIRGIKVKRLATICGKMSVG